MNLTIYDIAKAANVSISTVSRALNSPEKLAPSTLKKVRAVLDKYNYVPSSAAQALANRSGKTVGILVPDIRNTHFSSSAYFLEAFFSNLGYSTLLCNTSNGNDMEKRVDAIRLLASKRIDGLVLLGSVFSHAEIQNIVSTYLPSTPIVTSNAFLSGDNCYSVEIDHGHGMRAAVKHLIDRGFQSIYYVSGNESLNTQRKVQKFCAAMQESGLTEHPESNVLHCEHGPAGGRTIANEIAQAATEQRRGYIFMDDFTAIGAVSQLRKLGVDIPGNVGIIGHDNSIFSICAEPQLTTIDTHIESMASIMGDTLHSLFQGKTVGNKIVVSPHLVIRETT